MPLPTISITRQNRAFKLTKIQTREVQQDGQTVGKLTGYLAVYGNIDSYGTILTKGMFAKSLSERDKFPLLADHDPCMVIGVFNAREDDHGLYIEADVLLQIETAMEKWVALKAQAINGLSVGFEPVQWSWDEDAQVLRYTEGKLWEGSVVTFPSNELATVETLRSISAGARAKVAPVVNGLAKLAAAMPVVGLAADGQEAAREAALRAIEEMQIKLEALRQDLEAKTALEPAAAATDSTEPAQRHSEEMDAETFAELMRSAAGLGITLQPVTAQV